MKSFCHKCWVWNAWNFFVSFRVCNHTSIAICRVTFEIKLKPRNLLYQLALNHLSFFLNNVFGNTIIVGWCFLIKPGRRNIFLRSCIFSLRSVSNDITTGYSLHSLLYDIPGSESFNSELAQSFPLAGEFWNNFSSALRFPLAFFNKLCRSCSFRVLEGILILCQLKTKSWEKHEHWNILMDDKGGRGWLHLHIS